MSLSDDLNKLAELRASGALTEEEFANAKARVLNAQGARPEEPVMAPVNAFRRSRSDRIEVQGGADRRQCISRGDRGIA